MQVLDVVKRHYSAIVICVSLFPLRQEELDYKGLSFFELTGIPRYLEDGDDMSKGVGLTYNLETNILRWLKADAQSWGQLSLQDGRLKVWEPVTPHKIALIALELGIVSNIGASVYPGRLVEPHLSAVTINSDGVVFYRDSDDKLSISDVRRLTGGAQGVLDVGGISAILDTGEWTHFQLSPQGKITCSGPRKLAVDGWMPVPDHPRDFGFTSLGNCSRQAQRLGSSGRPFSAEATAFVMQRFGVDPHQIDHAGWVSANKARLLSSSFTNSTLFEHHAAIAALRIAVASEAAQSRTTTPTTTPRTPIHDTRPPQPPTL